MNRRESNSKASVIPVTDQIVVFTLDDLLYALPLTNVTKIIHAIEIRHLADAPDIIAGIINIKGRIIPVADIRKHLGLAAHEIDPDDRLILADTGKREVAIQVDTVVGIRDLEPGQLADNKKLAPFAKNIRGVVKTDDGLVLIYDLDKFLSIEEENELENALNTEKNEC